MSWVPTNDAEQKKAESLRKQGFDLAQVTKVPDNGGAVIEAEVFVPGSDGESVGSPIPTWVIVPNKGDMATPNSGDTIVLGYTRGGFAICFGVLYTRQERGQVPSYTKDERVIGHKATDSEIRINGDGTITVSSNDAEIRIESDGSVVMESSAGDKVEVDAGDGSVRVNDGTNAVVYDASVSTTTDGEGDVTSVSLNLSKSNKLKVP